MTHTAPSPPETRQTPRQIFIAWEKLRPLYIAISGMPAAMVLLGELTHPSGEFGRLTLVALQGGLVANVIYFAGPLIEAYANRVGWRSMITLRIFLFCVYTFFSFFAGAFLLLRASGRY
ncbi:MAG: hypothetical protein AAGD32_09800 [Planctomycetota bacterium]